MNKKEKPNKTPGKTPEIMLVFVFCAFLTVFFALILILPKKEGELSPNERRMLAEAPKLTFYNLASGKFADDTDAWLEDHFPGRAFFVPFYSYVSRAMGVNAAEDIIAGKANRLFPAPVKVNDETIIENAKALKKFADDNNLKTLSVVIPSAGFVLKNELPRLHLEYHDGEITEEFNAYLGKNTPAVDVGALIAGRQEPGKYYYKTDHHLTMDGSYLVYTAIAAKLGFDPVPEAAFKKTSYEFYGTSYGRSGLSLTPPDSLEVWLREDDSALLVTTFNGKTGTEHKGSVDTDCLKNGVVDKYAAYLYGNNGVTSVVNPNVETGALIVFKDSYANAVVPFLTAHYHEIIMIDTRHYNGETELPGEIVSRLGISDFLILCGTDTVGKDAEIAWMTFRRS